MADEEVQDVAPVEEVPAPPIRAGQGVIYVSNHAEEIREYPASVLEVHEDGSVRLAVSAGFSAAPIFFDANGAPGTWHLPKED
jgi:hypothetical protein